ncbi:Phosphate-binding protein PstS 1 [Halioglobus japonicus]|nr:Phosphate-binding protein PstS 1 [Halioglobus japonicus]
MINMRFLFVFSALMSMFVHSALAGQRLTLTGSSTIAPLVLEIGKRFEQQNVGVRVDVQTGGSSRGISDARTGLADIGMVSRVLHESEADLKAHAIAVDGVSMVLHRDNNIDTLCNDQIRDIYTGKIRNWRELGGADQQITVVNKAEGRSTLELFLAYFGLRNSQIRASVVIGDNQQGIKTIAGNAGAIGYVSIGAAEFVEYEGAPIKRLRMNGIQASTAQVRAGSFPLSRPLNLVTAGEPDELAQRFIRFAQGPDVDDLIESQFFVPLEH